jgi:hypothetical protein
MPMGSGELTSIETVRREERIREKTTAKRILNVFMGSDRTSGPTKGCAARL